MTGVDRLRAPGRGAGPGRPLAGRRAAALAVVVAVLVAGCAATAPPTADGRPATASPTPTREPVVYPDETTTGVPEGTRLVSSDSLTITEDGTVVDGLHVEGTITVEADDVVIRNTLVTSDGGYPIRVKGGRDLLVEDTEIDGQGKGYAAVAFSKYTLRRVHIHHVTEGPRIAGDDVTIEDSYIHSLVQKGDNHTDVVQLVGGTGVVVRGNNLQAYNPESGLLGNAAFMFGEDDKPVRDCLVEGNLLNGGNYTVNGGGSGTDGAACTFRDNQFQRDHRYGPQANLGPRVVWDDTNTWQDSWEPVRGTGS